MTEPFTCTPSPMFHDAASYLSSASSLSKVSNDTKLELYGLFKFVTTSAGPTTSRPSIFDFTGRAKWDAWSRIAKEYRDRAGDAERRYLEIANGLGWKAGTVEDVGRKEEDVPVDEIDWDDEGSEGGSGSSGGGGMGVTVSYMAPPPMQAEQDMGTIFEAVLSGEPQTLDAFLRHNPETDINGRDEYGYTPLQLACDRGSTAVVRLLLGKGADPKAKDPDEMTSTELARIAGHSEIVDLLKKA